MSSEFKIRRGQIFYIKNDCDQSLPYIVLSNNKCNDNSNVLHVAPVKQGKPDPDKYYHVPYTATCGRTKFVDVALVQLVPREKLSGLSYSAAESYYTVSNTQLMEGIADALCMHLGIHRNYVVYDENPVKEEKKEPINITINLAGLPGVTAQVTESNEVQIRPETVSTSIGTVVQMAKEPAKFTTTEGPSEWTVTNTRTGNETHVTTKDGVRYSQSRNGKYFRLSKNSDRKHFTDAQKDDIISYILKNYAVFGGTLGQNEVAEKLGVCTSTVTRYVALIKKNPDKYNAKARNVKTNNSKGGLNHRYKERVGSIVGNPKQTKDMTPEQVEKLMEDYLKFGSQYVVDNYTQFKTRQAVYNFFYRHCPKLENIK